MSKTATATKTKKALENPFREGSQRYHFAEALFAGGSLDTIAKKVAKKVKGLPEGALRGRVSVVAHILEDFGFDVEIEGRGDEARFTVKR